VHIPPARRRRTTTAMTENTTAPLTPRGRATHARIVGNAAELIFCQGLHNTSVGDVRRAATVSGSQMSHYFPDRRALVRGVIGSRRDEVVDFHTGGRLSRLDSFQALQDWADLNVQKQVDMNCAGGCSFGSLVGELLPSDEDVRTDLVAVYEEWIALFRSALIAMRKRGELRSDADPLHLARVLVAAHQGGSLLAQTTRSVSPLRDSLNAAVQYVASFASEPITLEPRRPTRRRAR
jgi:TetR/AcrR family transcriptional regulator, transcriptional repressor for nem operon